MDYEEFSRIQESERYQEILDKALRSVTRKKGSDCSLTYSFVLKANTPRINEYDKDVTYTVFFQNRDLNEISVQRKDIFGRSSIPVKLYEIDLSFLNDRTRYSTISGMAGDNKKPYSTAAVYSTVGRILYDYVDSVSVDEVQAVHFTTAHPGLVKPYLILSKEAERKAGLVRTEIQKYEHQEHAEFHLLYKEAVSKIKNSIQ